MPGKVTVGVKLMTRSDNEAGVVRAFFALIDESEKHEVATVSLQVLHSNPGFFDQWMEMLSNALSKFVEEVVGVDPSDVTNFVVKPDSRN